MWRRPGCRFVGHHGQRRRLRLQPDYASQVTGALRPGSTSCPTSSPTRSRSRRGTAAVHREGLAGDQRGERRRLQEGRPVPAGRARHGEPAARHLRGLLRAEPGADGDLDRPFITATKKQTGLSTDHLLEPELVAGLHRQQHRLRRRPALDRRLRRRQPRHPARLARLHVLAVLRQRHRQRHRAAPPTSTLLGAPSTVTAGTTGSIQLQTLNSLAGQSGLLRAGRVAAVAASRSARPAAQLVVGRGRDVLGEPSPRPARPPPAATVIPSSMAVTSGCTAPSP